MRSNTLIMILTLGSGSLQFSLSFTQCYPVFANNFHVNVHATTYVENHSMGSKRMLRGVRFKHHMGGADTTNMRMNMCSPDSQHQGILSFMSFGRSKCNRMGGITKLIEAREIILTMNESRSRSLLQAGVLLKLLLAVVVMTIPKRVHALTNAIPNLVASAAKPVVWICALAEGFQELMFPEMKKLASGIHDCLPPLEAMPRLIGQLALALAAYRISTIVAWGVRGYCLDNHIDVTTAVFLAELLRYGTLLLASIVLFQAFGVQTPQSFTAIVTSLTLAVGLSFQSVLSNFAAGVMLLVFRPYSVGDKVRIGNRVGFVYDISLLATRVDTEDNIRIQVPNSQILNGVVENYTLNPLRRVEVLITVSPRADVRKTKEVLYGSIASYGYLAIAGATGPGKSTSSSSHPSQHASGQHPPVSGTTDSLDGSGKGTTSWGGRALANLFKRRGNQWITPTELMKGLAAQYTQLWKVANGHFRLDLVDVAAKKAPGPEVVLREITPIGLRWQARVWAPSRRYTSVLYQMTESIALALADAGIELSAISMLNSGVALGYQLAHDSPTTQGQAELGTPSTGLQPSDILGQQP